MQRPARLRTDDWRWIREPAAQERAAPVALYERTAQGKGLSSFAPSFGPSSDELRKQLARRGIETRSFFVPMHLQPIYAGQFRGQRFPVAEQLCRTGFCMPTHENLDEHDADWICAQIRDIYQSAKAPPSVIANFECNMWKSSLTEMLLSSSMLE